MLAEVESEDPAAAAELPLFPPDVMAKLEADGGMSDRDMGRFVLGLQLTLKELGYLARPYNGQLDDRTRAALLAYRRDAGMKASSSLMDEALREQMDADTKRMVIPPHLGMPGYTDKGGLIMARGTWRLAGSKLAHAAQMTEILCFFAEGFCVESTAKVTMGPRGNVFLHVDIHAIAEVTADTLRTKPSKAACAQSSLLINRTQGLVSRTRVTTSTEASCSYITKENLHLDLVDPDEVMRPLQLESDKARAQILDLPRNLVD